MSSPSPPGPFIDAVADADEDDDDDDEDFFVFGSTGSSSEGSFSAASRPEVSCRDTYR